MQDYYGRRHSARAALKGGAIYPAIRGAADFTAAQGGGVIITVSVEGLPAFSRGAGAPVGPFGFHLHGGGDCSPGTAQNPFPNAGAHFNPDGSPHGNHAGDFPVIVAQGGRAWMSFYTAQLGIEDVIGKALVIHESPDDYRAEPAGNSGRKIACGIVE